MSNIIDKFIEENKRKYQIEINNLIEEGKQDDESIRKINHLEALINDEELARRGAIFDIQGSVDYYIGLISGANSFSSDEKMYNALTQTPFFSWMNYSEEEIREIMKKAHDGSLNMADLRKNIETRSGVYGFEKESLLALKQDIESKSLGKAV